MISSHEYKTKPFFTTNPQKKMFKFITCLLLAVPNVYSQGVTQDVIQAQSRGNQFTTGPCTQDAECQTGCCGNNLKCRNPQAFQSDAEFCQNGLTIDFEARNTVC
ncbi:hypothetical protein BC833DRAFT_388474 [Globomyces pollinis-pini]|nr:hypothetical protein BC833DRAFT_388474 [Globomyces pollinis-pini]